MYKYLWIDCFTKFPLNKENYQLIKNENKKICIVSPELQKQHEKIEEYRNYIIEHNIIPDMICCKSYNIINCLCNNQRFYCNHVKFYAKVQKKSSDKSELSKSTRSRDRTGTSVTSSVFETDASTNSATRA